MIKCPNCFCCNQLPLSIFNGRSPYFFKIHVKILLSCLTSDELSILTHVRKSCLQIKWFCYFVNIE
ncbi:DUF4224 domain-containing protein [Streptococcus suis]|nr:DUF4224 domain-containing protein [Streptococcus suis]